MTPSLFDELVPEPDCARAGHTWAKTETDWGPPYGVRLTWTCAACGEIRGRC
jgi:hypothetical protein